MNGIYYVRFSEIELPTEIKEEEEEGLIDSLIFWDDDEKRRKKMIKNKPPEDLKQHDEKDNPNEPKFTGIEAPEVKPIDEDYIPEEYQNNQITRKRMKKKHGYKLWPSWGDDDEEKFFQKMKRDIELELNHPMKIPQLFIWITQMVKKILAKEASKVLKLLMNI